MIEMRPNVCNLSSSRNLQIPRYWQPPNHESFLSRNILALAQYISNIEKNGFRVSRLTQQVQRCGDLQAFEGAG